MVFAKKYFFSYTAKLEGDTNFFVFYRYFEIKREKEYDIILVDVQMPGMNGLKQRIISKTRCVLHSQLFLLPTMLPQKTLKKLKKTGMHEYILKTY